MENKWENGDDTENVVAELLTTELKIPNKVLAQELDKAHRLPHGEKSDISKSFLFSIGFFLLEGWGESLRKSPSQYTPSP